MLLPHTAPPPLSPKRNMVISASFLASVLFHQAVCMDMSYGYAGSEADDAASLSPSDIASLSPKDEPSSLPIEDIDYYSESFYYTDSSYESSEDPFSVDYDGPTPILDYWKSPRFFKVARTSSFDSWCSRHNFDPYRKDVPTEKHFLSMLVSSDIHVCSSAIVLATFYEYSTIAQAMAVRYAKYGEVEYDYQDVVAALGIPWYDPFFMSMVLFDYPLCTEEMIWNVIQHGPQNSNDRFLMELLQKPISRDVSWTFFKPAMHYTGTFGISNHRLHLGYELVMVRQARALGFSKQVCRLMKRVFKNSNQTNMTHRQ